MDACASCSAVLQPGANFCPACGARVAAIPEVAREVRKTVTILFSDLAGSTELGERLDPEQLRSIMNRYFAAMSAVIERHGGTVEKFIGDAIMAVFGIPVLHEDDGVRAVRAASEMRAALAVLNTELAPRGIEIRTRTGINTGGVVTGSGERGTLVTGDAVNTAARLEQAAEAGEILIGEPTYRLVRGSVRAEEVASLTLKGKTLPVAAFRLDAVHEGFGSQVRKSPGALVGRHRELAMLRQTWDRVAGERNPQLFTLLGSAGVGKSRLSSEFLSEVAGPLVLRGRCLSYGEGMTYWPLAEVLRAAAHVEDSDSGDAARAKVEALVAGDANGSVIGNRLQEAIGLRSDGGAPRDELFWAVRRTLESLARSHPVIVVWDDLHWAEPTFLDLVEYLADWARDVPLLILAMARPELLELRPGWGGGKLNASTILLEPLTADASVDLLAALPGGSALPDELRRRIAETAEGNPFFLEEMLGMLVDEGSLVRRDGGWRTEASIEEVGVPATISAVLASRLDRLGRGERDVAERAAVVGRIFERAAVTELSPPPQRAEVAKHLLALVRKELVRPEAEPGLGGDDAFRFRHLLIRDAAYDAVPKLERARLHEAFAGWLELATGDRGGEYEEVIAHHLERAYAYRVEMGDTRTEVLGRRAAARLTAAARRAEARGDLPAAVVLRRRALDMPIAPDERPFLLMEQAYSHIHLGEWDASDALVHVIESDDGFDERGVLGLTCLVARRFLELQREASPPLTQIMEDARRAASELEAAGHAMGVAWALNLLAFAAYHSGDTTTAGAAFREAAHWAARSGNRAQEARFLAGLPANATYGWTTTAEAIEYCHSLAKAFPDSPMMHARLLGILALQHALRGERDAATVMRERSRTAATDLASPWLSGEVQWDYADVELLIGDPVRAEHEAVLAHELRVKADYREAWATIVTILSALRAQERWIDARYWLRRALEARGATDPIAVAQFGAWAALLSAVEGDATAARATLSETLPEPMDPRELALVLDLQAHALAITGDRQGASERATEALRIYERKEMLVDADTIRKRYGALAVPLGSEPP